MEDQGQQQQQQEAKSPRQGTERSEAVRSRWTPKPEQILILESIFNSGMVNPPKDETVRIRRLLEKFGAVGDANVFYWFQNRRSRSRRAQAQTLVGGAIPLDHTTQGNLVVASSATSTMGFGCSSSPSYAFLGSSSSSCGGGVIGGHQQGMEGFFSVSSQMGFPDHHTSPASSAFYPPLDPNLTYQAGYGGTNISGFITVFLNGIATELPKGPIDLKTVFGEDVMLVHSSGVPIPTNEFGFLMQNLRHGESYFLVGVYI
ncbi:WUSCHEL-related homeobox 11 [Glycine soja]|nr:WUSCHEL-related homeobox 11 [Glycine soja]